MSHSPLSSQQRALFIIHILGILQEYQEKKSFFLKLFGWCSGLHSFSARGNLFWVEVVVVLGGVCVWMDTFWVCLEVSGKVMSDVWVDELVFVGPEVCGLVACTDTFVIWVAFCSWYCCWNFALSLMRATIIILATTVIVTAHVRKPIYIGKNISIKRQYLMYKKIKKIIALSYIPLFYNVDKIKLYVKICYLNLDH